MVIGQCSVPSSEFQTTDVSEALAIALLANHALAHQNATPTEAAPAPKPQGPKLERPKVDVGVSIEDWNVFVRGWEVFRTGSGINEASAQSQLFQCAGTELGDSLLKANPNIASQPLEQLLAAMRPLWSSQLPRVFSGLSYSSCTKIVTKPAAHLRPEYAEKLKHARLMQSANMAKMLTTRTMSSVTSSSMDYPIQTYGVTSWAQKISLPNQ